MNEGILYIGGFELPDKNAAAQRVITNGKLFKELGYSVYYLGIDRTLIKKKSVLLTRNASDDFIFYNLKYPSGLAEWMLYLTSIKDITVIAGDISSLKYIIAYNYPAIALGKLIKWCKDKEIRLISDCTEWYQPQGSLLFRMIKGFDTYLRMRVIQPKLDGIITISSYLYEFYIKRMANVVQIPPLVDANSAKWNDKCLPYSNELTLVYAGSPGDGTKDRLDSIIKALSAIKSASQIKFKMHIIGLTKQQYIDIFGDKYLTEDLGSCIIFKGRLSHIDALEEVKCADYAIFVRDKGLVNMAGFPTKFVEALSCGTPVLTNESSNISDYLHSGQNGYLLDNSVDDALVRSLGIAMSQSKDRIDEMKTFIRKENTFDYRKYIPLITQFIHKIAIEQQK